MDINALQKIVADIICERRRQDAKFGGRDNLKSILPRVNTSEAQYAKLGVLMEEVGEVARAALEHDFGDDNAQLGHLQEELVQVAAVAIAWLESFALDDLAGGSRWQ